MATLTGLIPVTVGTFEAYHGRGVGGDTMGGGGAGNAERRTIYLGYFVVILGSWKRKWKLLLYRGCIGTTISKTRRRTHHFEYWGYTGFI